MPAPCTLTVRQAAESRRTVRRYVQQDVPEEDLRELLRQTRLAPSPDNIQPWRFIAIRDPGVRAQMLPLANHQPECVSAHALIVLYADMEDVLANLDEIIHPGLAEPAWARIKGNLAERFGALLGVGRQRFSRASAVGTGSRTSPSATWCSPRRRWGTAPRRYWTSTRPA